MELLGELGGIGPFQLRQHLFHDSGQVPLDPAARLDGDAAVEELRRDVVLLGEAADADEHVELARLLLRDPERYGPVAPPSAAVVVPFAHGLLLPREVQALHVGSHFRLLVREQMGVMKRDVHALVTHALGDGGNGIAELDEQAHVAVAQVVDADHLRARKRAAPPHLMVEERFRQPEYPLTFGDMLHLHVFPDLLHEERGDGDDAVRLGRLRAGDDVPSLDPLVGFADGKRAPARVEVRRGQRQQLAFADARPIQDREGQERDRLVHDLAPELQVLVASPELHLHRALLRAHLPRPAHRIGLEPVVPNRMVEHRGKLVADCAQVRLRKRLPRGIAQLLDVVLPMEHVRGGDLVDPEVTQVRQDLRLDDVRLGVPGVLLEARLHISLVKLVESRHGHVQGTFLLEDELLLPAQGLAAR